MKEPVTRVAYCQYLVVSQITDTLTNVADHTEQCSHAAIKRYLRGERITPRLVWENVAQDIVPTAAGYSIFDDTVLAKNASFAIELVRRQYSGKAGGVIKGIGVVTCVYVRTYAVLGFKLGRACGSKELSFVFVAVWCAEDAPHGHPEK